MAREEGKGRTPVPDCGSAKVATLKCGGPPTMPEENRGPWSKKFENRCATESPNSKVTGPDGIPAHLLDFTADEAAVDLQLIFRPLLY